MATLLFVAKFPTDMYCLFPEKSINPIVSLSKTFTKPFGSASMLNVREIFFANGGQIETISIAYKIHFIFGQTINDVEFLHPFIAFATTVLFLKRFTASEKAIVAKFLAITISYNLRSFSSIGKSLILAKRLRIKPFSSNSQFSFP